MKQPKARYSDGTKVFCTLTQNFQVIKGTPSWNGFTYMYSFEGTGLRCGEGYLLSKRLRAMRRWDDTDDKIKQDLTNIYFQGRNHSSLTGREIEEIYNYEFESNSRDLSKLSTSELQAELKKREVTEQKERANNFNSPEGRFERLRGNVYHSKYALNEQGVWAIYAEDSNCDLGGPHSNPYLETVEGTFENALKYAIGLKGFFTWGSGGYVKKAEKPVITKV